MPLSNRIIQSSTFIKDLNSDQFSIDLQSGQLVEIEKRSSLRNFLGWIIHLITFTLVPRNPGLDRCTQHILREMGQGLSESVTQENKSLLKKAAKNLLKIIHNNGGGQEGQVREILTRIRSLQPVQAVTPPRSNGRPLSIPGSPHSLGLGSSLEELERLFPSESVKEKEEVSNPLPTQSFRSSESTQLQVWQQEVDQFIEYAKSLEEIPEDEIFKMIAKTKGLLTQLQSMPLLASDDQMDFFIYASAYLFKEDRDFNSSQLSPQMVTSMVEHALRNGPLKLLSLLMEEVVKKDSFNRDHLLAIANGLSAHSKACQHSLEELVDLIELVQLPLIKAFKTHLLKEEFGHFLKDFFGLLISQASLAIPASNQDSQLLNDTESLLEQPSTLQLNEGENGHLNSSQEITNEPLVNDYDSADYNSAGIAEASQPDSAILGYPFSFAHRLLSILEDFSSLEPSDQLDREHQAVILQILSELEPLTWVNALPTRRLFVPLFHLLPKAIYLSFSDDAFMDIAQAIIANLPSDSVQRQALDSLLSDLAQSFLPDSIEKVEEKDSKFAALLLPFLSLDLQAKMVERAFFGEDRSLRYAFYSVDKNSKVPSNIFEEASKRIANREYDYDMSSYPPAILAQVVNGQVGNKAFLEGFLRSQFDYHDERVEKRQCLILEHLKLEVFEADDLLAILDSRWINFFKALDVMESAHGKALFAKVITALFSGDGWSSSQSAIFCELSEGQRQLLPEELHQKHLQIQLLQACLSNTLNDDLIAKFNEMAQTSEPRDCPDFFGESITTTQKQLFKRLVLWIVDRESIDSLRPTWEWINGSKEVLLWEEIKEDQQIQEAIKKLGLEVLQQSLPL